MAKIAGVSVLRGDDPLVSRSFAALRAAVNQLLRQPLPAGKLVGPVTFRAFTVQPVNHDLGRAWQGYFVVRTTSGSSPVHVQEIAATPALDARTQINLRSPVAGTCYLWVF